VKDSGLPGLKSSDRNRKEHWSPTGGPERDSVSLTCFRNSKGVGHRQAIANGESHLLRKDCRTKVHTGSSEQVKSDRSYGSPASLSLRIWQAGSRSRILECGIGGGKSFGYFRSTAGRKSCRQFPWTSRRLGGKKLALRSRNCAGSSRKWMKCSAVTVQ